MLKPSKCEPQTQNIKVQHVMNLRPHTSIYQKAQESIKLKAPKLWTWRKLKNSVNLKPKLKKKKNLTYCSKSWKPLQKIWIWNLKKIILEAQKSITFKTKKKRWTLEQQNQLTMRSKNLDALNGTLPKVYEQKKHKPGDPNLQEPEPKKSETSNSNK